MAVRPRALDCLARALGLRSIVPPRPARPALWRPHRLRGVCCRPAGRGARALVGRGGALGALQHRLRARGAACLARRGARHGDGQHGLGGRCVKQARAGAPACTSDLGCDIAPSCATLGRAWPQMAPKRPRGGSPLTCRSCWRPTHAFAPPRLHVRRSYPPPQRMSVGFIARDTRRLDSAAHGPSSDSHLCAPICATAP